MILTSGVGVGVWVWCNEGGAIKCNPEASTFFPYSTSDTNSLRVSGLFLYFTKNKVNMIFHRYKLINIWYKHGTVL